MLLRCLATAPQGAGLRHAPPLPAHPTEDAARTARRWPRETSKTSRSGARSSQNAGTKPLTTAYRLSKDFGGAAYALACAPVAGSVRSRHAAGCRRLPRLGRQGKERRGQKRQDRHTARRPPRPQATKPRALDLGLPAYPGAQVSPEHEGDKSADVHLGFGQFQLRIRVVTYETSDDRDKVIAFYKNAMGRFGEVLTCQGNRPVGSPTITGEGLTCNEDSKVHVNQRQPRQRQRLHPPRRLQTPPAHPRHQEWRPWHPLLAGRTSAPHRPR